LHTWMSTDGKDLYRVTVYLEEKLLHPDDF
jgi:hypothetical protein